MKSNIGQLKYYFVGAIAVVSIAITAYEWLYDIPMKKCEQSGSWWSWKYRECTAPIYLPTLTGRPAKPGEKKTATIDWHGKGAPPPQP